MKHYAAILIAIASVVTAATGAIPAPYAGIASAVVVVLYAVAKVLEGSANPRPGKIIG